MFFLVCVGMAVMVYIIGTCMVVEHGFGCGVGLNNKVRIFCVD